MRRGDVVEAKLPGHRHDCCFCRHLTASVWRPVEVVSVSAGWAVVRNPVTGFEQSLPVSSLRERVLFGEAS